MDVPNITITVRHHADCPHRSKGIYYRRCDCLKHLEWNIQGRRFRESTRERAWAGAENAKRTLEEKFAGSAAPAPATITVSAAVENFLIAKRGANGNVDWVRRYQRELNRLRHFCDTHYKFLLGDVTPDDLNQYRLSWEKVYPSTQTRQAVQGRLKEFFRFCIKTRKLNYNPADALMPLRCLQPRIEPLTAPQYAALLAAVPQLFPEERRRRRCLALIRLMRETGLAIADALSLPRVALVEIEGVMHVDTERLKTGGHVRVPIRRDLVEQLEALPNRHPGYFFWAGKSIKATAKKWAADYFRPLFDAIGMPNGHSHQLRHTAAVGWLTDGIPLDEVSKLLGHKSIRTTEKYYAKWVKARQQRLTQMVVSSWGERTAHVPATPTAGPSHELVQ